MNTVTPIDSRAERAPQSLCFTVPGPPVAKQRARLKRSYRLGGKPQFYTPKKTADYEKRTRTFCMQALQVWAQQTKFLWDGSGKFSVTIDFYTKGGGRRDVDNMAKSILDAMNGLVYDDDSQVTSLMSTKAPDTLNPRAVVAIERLPDR